jgi:ATP-binding cassette subfamily B protein
MSELRGDIVFKDVSFRYPARPETLALQNVDVTLEAGKVFILS